MISRFQNLVQHNLSAKIVALLAATILWSFVMNEQNPVIDGSFTVSVQLVNAPEGCKVTQETKSAKLKVRGTRSTFINASEKDFKAYIDLSDQDSGRKSLKIQTVLPQGLELVEVQPDTASVVIERIVSKTFKAEIVATGAAAPGTTVAHVGSSVQYVTAEGTESAIKEVARVVGYVSLAGNSGDFTQQVSLAAINAEGREVQGVTLTPDHSDVSVQLARGLSKKIVAIRPVADTDLSKDLTLVSMQAAPAKVEIAGAEDAIKGISTLDTDKIALSDVKASMDKKIKLQLPDGVTVTNQDVTVHIEVKAKKKE